MTQNIRRGIRAGREKELREIRGGKRKGGLAVCEQCLVSNRAQRSLRKVVGGGPVLESRESFKVP